MLDIHASPTQGYYNLTDLSRLWINCAFLLNSNTCLRAQVGTKYFSHSFLNHPRDNCLLHVYAYSTCNPDECMQTVIRHEGFLRLSWVWVVWNALAWCSVFHHLCTLFVNQRLGLRQTCLFLCVKQHRNGGRWMSVWQLLLERSYFHKCFSYLSLICSNEVLFKKKCFLIIFFNFIHVQKLNKVILYVNPKS